MENNNCANYYLIDRGEIVELGSEGFREALHTAFDRQIGIWEEFGSVLHAPYILDSIYKKEGDTLSNIPSETVKEVMREDFPADWHAYIENAEQVANEAEKEALLNAKTIVECEPIWNYDYTYFDVEYERCSIRLDRIQKIVLLSFQDDDGLGLASVGVRLEKDYDDELFPMHIGDFEYLVDCVPHPVKSGSALEEKLQRMAQAYCEEHKTEMFKQFLSEEANYKKALPPVKTPGIDALYTFQTPNGTLTLPLINIGKNPKLLKPMLSAVFLKDIHDLTLEFFHYENNKDPNKFKKLADKFDLRAFITDGKTVWEASIGLPNISGLEKNRLLMTTLVVYSSTIEAEYPVTKTIPLTRMLPFDSDYDIELKYGDYLPTSHKEKTLHRYSR